MNKDLVSELVKVANSLDNMGLNKEASNLDKIARKIVVSEAAHYDLPKTYKSAIDHYKYLITMFQQEANSEKKKEWAQEATWFLQDVQKADSTLYTDSQKSTFIDQAAAIRNSIYGNLNDNVLNDKLAMLLKTSPYLVSQGVIIGTEDIKKFTDFWMTQIQPEFEIISNRNIAKWLSSKFLIYKKQILANNAKAEADKKASEPSWWERTFGGKK
jgi:hypothetical protein